MTTLTVNDRKTSRFLKKKKRFFSVFRFSIHIANITILFNLIRFYRKYFYIFLSFNLYSLGENKLLYPHTLLPFNMKSRIPIQKYPHVIESYACFL